MSTIWVIISHNQYSYNYTFLEYRGFDWFPFLLLGIGLFIIYNFYLYLLNKLKIQGIVKEFLFFLAVYWPILIIVETVGYYTFGVHNMPTASYQGLPICNCMHAPPWMQIAYFSFGPIYFFGVYLLKLKNNSKNNVG